MAEMGLIKYWHAALLTVGDSAIVAKYVPRALGHTPHFFLYLYLYMDGIDI